MERRAVSLAFYFTGLFLAVALVFTVRRAPFPFLLVRYWPMVSALLLTLAAFCWKAPDNRSVSTWGLRAVSLVHLSLSPFFCWYCQMKAVGVGFALTGAHIYLQSMVLLYVASVPLLMGIFGGVARQARDELRDVVAVCEESVVRGVARQARELRERMMSRALWRYSFYLLLAPMLAVLAGSLYLSLLHTPPDGNPLKLLPVALLEAAMQPPMPGLFELLLALAVLGQLLGAIRLLSATKSAEP